ncbi:glycosyltransferase family 4 protein [Halobacillus halophilus]|uniref:glycosyltransferase family 4 protein n=1 Tax=Halobacillus halophilus TaxID=1570 RepID=UPI001CD4383F|nr:glycosyltransferase family 4 protein [Halobacillus halophilus]MCA1012709.1 glycosyltransferase family 4 protein [Halobacillus halophilus]
MAKILQVCSVDETAEKLLKPLLSGLEKEGHEVHTVCADTGRTLSLREEGYTLITLPFKRKISPFNHLRILYQLYRLMKKEKYDIVHVHTPIAAAIGRVAAKMAGIKHIVYTAHGFYFHEGMPKLKYLFWFQLEKQLAKYFTDYLLLQSIEDYELCVHSRFLPEDYLLHLSNGVDVEESFNPALYNQRIRLNVRKELGASSEDRVICFIGRLVREKGIFELLESFHQVKDQRKNARLLVIGTLSESERDQQSYYRLKELLEDPSILSVGYRNDIADLLYASDVFVLPSYREGLPRSIIEAMAMGLPVIATDIRGCREEVRHGENGYLIPTQDTTVLTDKLIQLIDQDELRNTLGTNGRLMAEDLFNETKVVEKQIQLFRCLVASSEERSLKNEADS